MQGCSSCTCQLPGGNSDFRIALDPVRLTRTRTHPQWEKNYLNTQRLEKFERFNPLKRSMLEASSAGLEQEGS